VRQRRLVELRGMTAQDAAARIASQVSDHARLAVADVVIDTSGSIDETLRQTDEVWERLPALVAERTERAERAEHAER
jgi:dephospho-CoA kinase